MPKLLVLGNGQLAKALKLLSSELGSKRYQVTSLDRRDVDFACDIDFEKLSALEFDVLINCVAFTRVDDAESSEREADQINGHALVRLVDLCRDKKARLLHIGTDYVFDGNSGEDIEVLHPINPINAYGRSKAIGEKVVQNYAQGVVVRTSWLISPFGNNFLSSMVLKARDREAVSVVNDQFGTPTSCLDLASMLVNIALTDETTFGSLDESNRLFHFTSGGSCSWYELTDFIYELEIGPNDLVTPVPSSAYPVVAKRPSHSVLSLKASRSLIGFKFSNWRDSVRELVGIHP